jgi:hypothetical protein
MIESLASEEQAKYLRLRERISRAKKATRKHDEDVHLRLQERSSRAKMTRS